LVVSFPHNRGIVACLALVWALSLAVSGVSEARTGGSNLRLVRAEGGIEISEGLQVQTVGGEVPNPLRVRVLGPEDVPVAGIPVRFSIAATPPEAEGAAIDRRLVETDAGGYAQTRLFLGSKPGEYIVTASAAAAAPGKDLVVFQAVGRRSDWVLLLVVGLAGGLGMFLFGIKLLSEGMKKTAAARLRTILGGLTRKPVIGLLAGALITVMFQSSSATTVMLVSFVQARLMAFAQTLGIILGAGIGTTVTTQLIAFNLSDYSLLVLAVGVALMMIPRRASLRSAGEAIFGFGLLFFGMQVMSDSMKPLRTYQPFVSLLVTLENPFLGLLVGTLFTGLIQSSAAFIGILIVLASQGLLTLEAGIPLMFGANIGTCITAGLAGLGTSREAKRVAVAHVLFKVLGVLLFIWWIPTFAEFVRWISPDGVAGVEGTRHLARVVPRQLANAHTVFNVVLAFALLPFTGRVGRLITAMLPPVPESKEPPFPTRYLDDALVSTPALALNLAKAEVLRMGEIVETMLAEVLLPFTERARGALADLERHEEEVDFLENRLLDYLTEISRQDIPEQQTGEVFQMMYTVTELEQIADVISKTLHPRAARWLEKDVRFSTEGESELRDFHLRTSKQLHRAIEVFRDVNLEGAKRMKQKYKKYRAMEEQLLLTHFERIREDVPETIATREVHQDLMEQFRVITGHATNIARILIDWTVPPGEKGTSEDETGS